MLATSTSGYLTFLVNAVTGDVETQRVLVRFPDKSGLEPRRRKSATIPQSYEHELHFGRFWEVQGWADKYPLWFFFSSLLFMYLAVSFVTSWWSGWRSLTRQFVLGAKFNGALWRAQSGQMRWLCSYRGCLTVGADSNGLYLATFPFFPLFHPPLFIPWYEVRLARKHLLLVSQVRFELGKELSIPLWVGDRLAARLREVAGDGYPIETLG